MQNLSYENEFYLHLNENSFSYERLCTKPCFEEEVQDNSEMAYWNIFSQNLCSYVHFRAVSLIHSALQRNAATLCTVLAPFSFSHVIDACSLLSLFSLSFFALS